MVDCLEKRPFVSVVIPVYNGERYLSAAIGSVVGQTYDNWELLVIDDGSTDGSAAVCDKYAAGDTRIKVWHQPNGGVNVARATAVDNASGDYFFFLDADDTLPLDAMERALSHVEDGVSVIAMGENDRIVDKEQYMVELLSGTIAPALWGKLFLASTFKNVDYHLERKLAMGEDLLINLMVALNSESVKVITDKIYEVNRSNPQSVTKIFKRTWAYEKYYFNQLESHFLSKCASLTRYDELVYLVNKSKLNGIKYVMLDGNKVNYKDDAFIVLSEYFKSRKHQLGPSEKLIFLLKNAFLYRMVMNCYLRR